MDITTKFKIAPPEKTYGKLAIGIVVTIVVLIAGYIIYTFKLDAQAQVKDPFSDKAKDSYYFQKMRAKEEQKRRQDKLEKFLSEK